jgi:hypothetical protein
LKYAKGLVVENGGLATDTELKIKVQSPQPFAFEDAFPKLVFDHNVSVFDKTGWEFKGKWENYKRNEKDNQAMVSGNKGDEATLSFEGTGVSIEGNWFADCGKADIFVDGELKRTVDEYFNFANQTHTNMNIYHITNLKPGKHILKILVKGEKRPEATAANVYLTKAIVFKTADKTNENYKFSFQK